MSKNSTAELLEELDDKIENVKSSEEFQEMLDFFSKFHNYSYHNTLLIQMQYPEATQVAGYHQWKNKFNRHVKKGEKGIAILAPFSYKTTESKVREVVSSDGEIIEEEVEEEVKKTYFKPVYVFDISQTEGEPVPRMDLSLEDSLPSLLVILKEFAEKRDISVKFRPLSDGLEGYSEGGNIVVDDNLNDTEKSATLVHELAHVMLHNREIRDDSEKYLRKEIKEMEAEAVAYVVFNHYGMEVKSDKYLALYKESYNLKGSLERIKKVSSEIITFCDDAVH